MENSNQPAFPVQTDVLNDAENDMQVIKGTPGLTKREYFAAKAMQGILSAKGIDKSLASYNSAVIDQNNREKFCKEVIAITDELLKQLETSKP